MQRQFHLWFALGRLMAFAVSAVVLIALVTMPLDANLFYAAIITIAGCLMMGWLEMGAPGAVSKRR